MDFNKFMSAISLREETLDDLTYLQKHLRLFIKFHQVSDKPTKSRASLLTDHCHSMVIIVSRHPTYISEKQLMSCEKFVRVSCGVTFHDIDLLLLVHIIAEIVVEALRDSRRR